MKKSFLLNHICRPALSVEELLRTSHGLGLGGIELRNDMGSEDPLGGGDAARIRDLADDLGQQIVTINALQRCNDGSLRRELVSGLSVLAETAEAVDVRGIVLCPVNDRSDRRSDSERMRDLVGNLREFAPLLEERGIIGLLEPLGFAESSLRSIRTAAAAISDSGRDCFRIVLDSFHHCLGPDTFDDLAAVPIGSIGLVHVSGVEEDVPFEEMRDGHRVLVSSEDVLQSRRQLMILADRGYEGPVSFEPFSESIQRLSSDAFRRQLRESLAYLSQVL